MLRKLGWGEGRAAYVDIRFLLVEPCNDGTIVKRQRWIRQVDTSSTTYGTVKEIACGLFEIYGDIELWLLISTEDCPSGLGSSLGANEPISKVITTRDATLQVEKLLEHEYLISSTTHDTTLPILRYGEGDRIEALSSALASAASVDRNDAEIARTLSFEINRSGNSRARTKPLQILSWARDPRTLGKLVAQASYSQFSIAGGQSACTSICLYAAAQLLSRMNETPRCITTRVLDDFLVVGSALHQNVALQIGDCYTSVDDLWNQSDFQHVVRPLARGPPISGTTHSFQEGLVAAMSYAQSQGERSVALVVTKPPVTILLLCKDANRSGPWFIFDSHGEDCQFLKKAFVRQLGSTEAAVAALFRKFPSVQETRGPLHTKQMNMYEAHPIVNKVNEKEQLDFETALALS